MCDMTERTSRICCRDAQASYVESGGLCAQWLAEHGRLNDHLQRQVPLGSRLAYVSAARAKVKLCGSERDITPHRHKYQITEKKQVG